MIKKHRVTLKALEHEELAALLARGKADVRKLKHAQVLLLDEPTSGLDPKASNEFSELLRQLSGQGTAVFMATHDIFRAKEVGTRVGIMREGELVDVRPTTALNANELEQLYLTYMQ